MSRPNQGSSRPLGTVPKASSGSASAKSGSVAAGPRRSAGTLPGIARTASSLRQHSTSPSNPSSLASIPAHLRNLSTPRIPSPLGKGTPARGTKQTLPVRTSKTTEKHVLLPEDPQLAPLPSSPSDVNLLRAGRPRSFSASSAGPSGAATPHTRSSQSHFGAYHHDERSEAERMTKREREESGLRRLTAYSTADGYRLKLLQAFLRREHGVAVVRVFDDCIYAVYNLPLLPGYGASTRIRSSPAVKSPGGVSMLERMTQAEDVGYDDEYFPVITEEPVAPHDPSEYILSHSPPNSEAVLEGMEGIMHDGDQPQSHEELRNPDHEPQTHEELRNPDESRERNHVEHEGGDANGAGEHHDHHPGTHMSPTHPGHLEHTPSTALEPSELHKPRVTRKRYPSPPRRRRKSHSNQRIAEAVFFSYGVSVFFGLQAGEEHAIMADCEAAGIWQHGSKEEDWEIEEFHYDYDVDAESPRIYNDMFTFKSRSHLFKLSLAHAIAQSTKLSIYESMLQESLALTSSFPKELSTTGHLQLNRIEALKMTGRLFKLRMDVNLIGGILDTPELFWSEASLYPLYEAINQYLEIGPRVQVLNDRLAVVGDLLEIIHEYIDQRAMHRITWVVIWLIVVACVVEIGEVLARLVFHSIARDRGEFLIVRATRTVLGITPR